MIDTRDEPRRWSWRRRAGAAGGLAVVLAAGLFAYRWYTDPGPEVPPQIVQTVAGPQVRIVHSVSHEDSSAVERPAYLVVEVDGPGDPADVLTATLRAHGWQTGGEHDAWRPVTDSQGYWLVWGKASAGEGPRPDPHIFPLAEYVDRADERQLLVVIHPPTAQAESAGAPPQALGVGTSSSTTSISSSAISWATPSSCVNAALRIAACSPREASSAARSW